MTAGPVRQLALVETYMSGGVTLVRDSFRLNPSFGAVHCQSLDLGFPQIRASVQDNPSADGTYDTTSYVGARSVALTGFVLQDAYGDDPARGGWDPSVQWNSASWFCRYLSAWAAPWRRSRLYFTDDSGLARFMDVRGDSWSAPITAEKKRHREWQLGFVNPSGKMYSMATGEGATADGRRRQRIRQSSLAFPGRSYPEPGPYVRDYPVPPAGATAVNYRGSVPNGFVANIYTASEPMVDPRLNVTAPDGTVQTIGITGYTIPANTVIRIDTTERTITTSTGVELDQYKTAPVRWPQLWPGVRPGQPAGYNAIGLAVSRSAADAYVEVLWFDADLA